MRVAQRGAIPHQRGDSPGKSGGMQ